MPPVSTTVNFLPRHSASAYSLSRVTPGLFSVFGDGNFSARDLVEEGALPHVRAADDGDQRIAHSFSPAPEKGCVSFLFPAIIQKIAAFVKKKAACRSKPLFYIFSVSAKVDAEHTQHAAEDIDDQRDPKNDAPYNAEPPAESISRESDRNQKRELRDQIEDIACNRPVKQSAESKSKRRDDERHKRAEFYKVALCLPFQPYKIISLLFCSYVLYHFIVRFSSERMYFFATFPQKFCRKSRRRA